MIAIVKYNAGNVCSVQNALDRLDVPYVLTNRPEELLSADKVIFPGVGEASSAMRFLKDLKLDLLLPTFKQPVLGVCLGQQLMCAHLEEGDVEGLGIFDLEVRHFPKHDHLPVPHMGWNTLQQLRSPLFEGISEQDDVYFVHSYYVEESPLATAICDYIVPFSAALQKANFYATQFHPEKSGAVGQRILQNFINL